MKINLDIELFNEEGDILHDYSLKDAIKKTLDDANSNKITTIKEFVDYLNKYKGKVANIGTIFRRALLYRFPEDDFEVDEGQRRFNVAAEMAKGGIYDLTEQDRDIIKKFLKKEQSIAVLGQIMNLMNPTDFKKKK